MIDSRYRNGYQTLLVDPVANVLAAGRVSPIALTALACLSGVLIVPLLYLGLTYWAFAALVFSGYLDTLDGTLARRQQSTSPVGAVLDIVSDRIVEVSVLIGLFLVAPEARGLHCILMLGSTLLCITSFLVVGIFVPNDSSKSFFYSPGIIERAEAFLFFGTMILFPSSFFVLATIFAILVTLTSVIRIYQFAKQNQ